MPKEIELESAAQILIERHGAKAAHVAGLRVGTCEREGQVEAAAIWKRIVERIHKITD